MLFSVKIMDKFTLHENNNNNKINKSYFPWVKLKVSD